MKITRLLAITVIASSIGLMAAEAKSLKEAEIPAEFPPASFSGKQYVDSRGCVYIRAGIDGLTNWVPRVTRSRQVLCGYQPTLAKAAPQPAPAPAPAKPVPVITPAPEAKPVSVVAAPASKPAPKPAPKRVAQVAPLKAAPTKAAPVKRKVKPVTYAPKPRRKAVQIAPAPAVPVKPIVATRPVAEKVAVKGKVRRVTRPTQVTTCEGVTGVSRLYSGVSTDDLPVRCGPQTEPYVTVVQRETVTVNRGGSPVAVQRRVVRQVQATVAAPRTVKTAQAATVGGQVRIAPKHVWEKQQASRVGTGIPDGYRPAWSDDRLNKQRAHQTFDGIYTSGLAWTRTVPRKLYVRSTGLVVTDKYPGLRYPYHSYEEMQAAGFDRPLYEPSINPAPTRNVVRKAAPRKAVVATKSAKRAAPAAPVKGRFVQVGTFGVEANARRTAARLQSMGMPARLGRLTKGGKTYRIVLTGPFAPNQLGAALSQARRAGFSDAFVR